MAGLSPIKALEATDHTSDAECVYIDFVTRIESGCRKRGLSSWNTMDLEHDVFCYRDIVRMPWCILSVFCDSKAIISWLTQTSLDKIAAPVTKATT